MNSKIKRKLLFKNLIACLTLLFFAWHLGCANILLQSKPDIPSEGERRKFGTIGIASAPLPTEVKIQTPAKGAVSGAGRGAAKGFLTVVKTGLSAGGSGSELGFLFFVASLATSPVGALIGGIYGAATAPPKVEIEENETLLMTTLADIKIQEEVKDNIYKLALDKTSYPFMLLTKQGSPDPDNKVDYQSMANNGIDTILEIEVPIIGLGGEWGINPTLTFFMIAQTKLIRVVDGNIIHVHTSEYRGEQRLFTEWGANNAELFRKEFNLACHRLAEKIVDELFLMYLPPESQTAQQFSLTPADGTSIEQTER